MDSKIDERAVVSFPDWKLALGKSGLPLAERMAFAQEIFAFLRFCKTRRAPVSVMLAKLYIDQAEGQAKKRDEGLRGALRWFVTKGAVYRAAPARLFVAGVGTSGEGSEPASSGAEPCKTAVGLKRSTTPKLAADDRGESFWEQRLIAACRERGFLWRTEETYRAWARRFADFIKPRTPQTAEAKDIGGFLSELAVGQRASASSQKQALNALVFLMQEALRVDIGKIDFQRAYPRERMPVVLSREECQRLFGQLTGNTRLMAELMYGTGLRLMELLRLRVHHLDMDRNQLRVHGGGSRIAASPHAIGGV